MRLKFVVFVILSMALIVSACGPANTEFVALKIGWTGAPDSLNPAMGLFTESYVIYDLVYSALYTYSTNGTFKLDAAERVSISVDQLTWTFKLRPNIKFSDGTPLTSEDVVFSFRLYAAYADSFPYVSAYTSAFADVVASAPDEVMLTLKEPIPNLESQLFTLYILPEHVWRNVHDPVSYDNAAMIGSGPFKLVEYQAGQHLRLAVNDLYYGGQPALDEIIFTTFPDSETLTQAIITGEVDMLYGAPIEMMDQLRIDPNIKIVSGQPRSPSVFDIIINQIKEDDCPLLESVCSGHPALRDLAVRRALAHATNKAELIENVVQGLADPGLTLIPSGLGNFFDNSLTDYPFDLDKAKRILDEAGYVDTNGDKIREMPGGERALIFRIQWEDSDEANGKIAVFLQAWWSLLGIDVQLASVDSDTLASNVAAYDYDIALWGWESDPDPSFLLGVLTSANIKTGYNETGYANPIYDELFNQQASTLDPDERRAIIWEMQKIMLDDVVYIIPYYPQIVQAYRTDKFIGWNINAKTLALQSAESVLKLTPLINR